MQYALRANLRRTPPRALGNILFQARHVVIGGRPLEAHSRLGPPGVGKTHLATALAVQALDAGHSVVFSTLSQLADGLESGAQFQSWRGRLRRYAQPHVLVIDEIGYTRLTPAQAHALFELVNARYEKDLL